MSTIKRAIFIAAGEGRRLRPVTLETPKPLIKVNGKRIIDTSIEALKKNGIHEIYIVVGYKKEQFFEAYKNDPDIRIIENPIYQQGNSITSMYIVREHLPESFVIEADIQVYDPNIFHVNIEKSGYFATWMDKTPEWALTVENSRIVKCQKERAENAYRLWGISAWNRADGERLAEDIRREFEKKNWNIFWDEIALMEKTDRYNLGIREIPLDAVCEIDTLEELTQMDSFYKKYMKKKKRGEEQT